MIDISRRRYSIYQFNINYHREKGYLPDKWIPYRYCDNHWTILELNLLSHYNCVIELSFCSKQSSVRSSERRIILFIRSWMHLEYATCSGKSFDTESYRFYLERSSRARWHWHCSRACTDAGLPSVDREPYMHLTINLHRVPRDGSCFAQDIVPLIRRSEKKTCSLRRNIYFFVRRFSHYIIDTLWFNSTQLVFFPNALSQIILKKSNDSSAF